MEITKSNHFGKIFIPDISFIIPFRNEEIFLGQTLESIMNQVLDGVKAEIILVDGMSTDASREIAERYLNISSNNLRFLLLINTKKTAPTAFNLGIQSAKAPIIGFGGAHSIYKPQYLQLAVELLKNTRTDVIGGGHDQIISSDCGLISIAIGCLYLSPMGAGVASYHRFKKPCYVDTVYGGFYRREVFEEIGLFNEKLVKNQDNELNARVTKYGLKIFFHPDLSSTYIQKTDLKAFLKRAYLFGFFHPETWLVNYSSFRIRHFIPAIWVGYLFILILLISAKIPHVSLFSIPFVTYILLLFISAFKFMIIKSVLVGLTTIPLFFIYHILYGLGIYIGAISALINRVKK